MIPQRETKNAKIRYKWALMVAEGGSLSYRAIDEEFAKEHEILCASCARIKTYNSGDYDRRVS